MIEIGRDMDYMDDRDIDYKDNIDREIEIWMI